MFDGLLPNPKFLFYFRKNLISTVALVLHCPKGGYIHMRHNEFRSFFTNFLCEVCHHVEIDPHFQPLQREILLLDERELIIIP